MKRELIINLDKVYNLLDHLAHEEKDRELPLIWEKVHATSCAQIGRLLALKRGFDQELAAFACSVHDIGRWYTGKQADHARNGEEYIKNFMRSTDLAEEVQEAIVQAAIKHSEKENVGTPLEEIVKDADILDCYLHGDEITRPYHLARLNKIRQELNIN